MATHQLGSSLIHMTPAPDPGPNTRTGTGKGQARDRGSPKSTDSTPSGGYTLNKQQKQRPLIFTVMVLSAYANKLSCITNCRPPVHGPHDKLENIDRMPRDRLILVF